MARKIPTLGQMNERVEILTRIDAPSASGGTQTSFISLGTFWARVEPNVERLASQENARQTKTSLSAVLRFRGDIGTGDKIVWRSEEFELTSSRDLTGRKSFMELRAQSFEILGGR